MMSPRERIEQVLQKTGQGLSPDAVDMMVMTMDNAVVAERESCAAIADDHRCDTAPECCNCQGHIAREIRARSKQE